MLMEWKTIQIDWVFMEKYWKRGLREDGRGLKQISHEKPFKKLFLGVSWLSELRSELWNFLWVTSESRDESRKLLDELATCITQLASCEMSRENFRESRG